LRSTDVVLRAVEEMTESNCGSVLIVNADGRLEGIFTERDLMTRVVVKRLEVATTTLGDVMTTKVAALGPRDRAIDALHLMHDGGFRHVPVIEGGRVRTLVLRSDFRALERAQIETEEVMFARIR
jgi:CBS domain-containing protein